jgi:hypothetical protein
MSERRLVAAKKPAVADEAGWMKQMFFDDNAGYHAGVKRAWRARTAARTAAIP